MADEQHSIQTYVSDMLALERHMAKPFATQRDDDDFQFGATPEILERLSQLNKAHVSRLEICLKDLGGHEASGIKEAVAQLEGMAAGAIDKIRKTKVSKALRDDYTALALSTISYTMLQTTALSLEEREVADLARQHLEDYAGCIMQIGEEMPEIVLAELQDIGLSVDRIMAEPARRAAEQAWRRSASESSTTTGTIGSRSPARSSAQDTF